MIETPHTKPDLLDQIDDYILDRMSARDRELFEKEIEDNLDVREAVSAQTEIIKGIELGALEKLLSDIDESHRRKTNGSSNTDAQPVRYWYAVSAGFLALFAICAWMYFKPDPANPQLYSHYAKSVAVHEFGSDLSSNHPFYDALVSYRNQNYTAAVEKWLALEAQYPQNDTLQYFIGATYFTRGHIDKAIPYLNSVGEDSFSVYREKSQWLLVLCWLRTGDVENITALSPNELPSYRQEISDIKRKLSDLK